MDNCAAAPTWPDAGSIATNCHPEYSDDTTRREATPREPREPSGVREPAKPFGCALLPPTPLLGALAVLDVFASRVLGGIWATACEQYSEHTTESVCDTPNPQLSVLKKREGGGGGIFQQYTRPPIPRPVVTHGCVRARHAKCSPGKRHGGILLSPCSHNEEARVCAS